MVHLRELPLPNRRQSHSSNTESWKSWSPLRLRHQAVGYPLCPPGPLEPSPLLLTGPRLAAPDHETQIEVARCVSNAAPAGPAPHFPLARFLAEQSICRYSPVDGKEPPRRHRLSACLRNSAGSSVSRAPLSLRVSPNSLTRLFL